MLDHCTTGAQPQNRLVLWAFRSAQQPVIQLSDDNKLLKKPNKTGFAHQ